jgi:hypothetical protein
MIRTVHLVDCDLTGCDREFVPLHSYTPRGARDDAATDGWLTQTKFHDADGSLRYGDLCPDHKEAAHA